MENSFKKILSVIVFFILMLIMIGIATNIESMENAPFIIGLIVVLLVIYIPIAIAKKTPDIYDKTKEIINDRIYLSKETKEIKFSLNLYDEAKKSYRYLSDDTLKAKYETYNNTQVNDMERLALEEELVERKLIPYSPMHEKIQKIKNNHKT
jgi:hypothetical protein